MIGKVAKCQKGMTGLVTSVHWTSRDTDIPLCKGVCLDPGRVGQPWQSLKPEWIGTLDEWVELRHAEIWRAAMLVADVDYDTLCRRNLT